MSVLSDDRRLHGHLIGQQGSRRALNTPVLVVDLDVLEANIAAMARRAAAGGARLRPHAKTHKSVDIARRQVAVGAFGLCCAKLGEAEALAAGDIPNLHITSPVVSAPAIARLATLNDRSPGLSVVADHPDNVAALAQAASVERPLTVFVDVDPGIRRTGVANDSDAVALARQIAAAPSLRFGGVQKYCGREQHIEDFAERRAAIVAQTEALSGTSPPGRPRAWPRQWSPAAAPGRTRSTWNWASSTSCRSAPTCSWTTSIWRAGSPQSRARPMDGA